jgi:hypothetical protein
MSVISFLDFKNKKQVALHSNTTQGILNACTESYMHHLMEYDVNIEDPTVAFDVATIQYLMRGMAHRSQGESHPSQIILDSLKERIMG